MKAPIRIASDSDVRPALCSVTEFAFDSGSKEFLSDEVLLRSLPDEDLGEEACFALEGYVTSGGDTVASLAGRYGLDGDALSVLNGVAADAALPAGTRVTLYRGDFVIYAAESGESLDDIARKFGTDALLLTVCNHCKSTTMDGGERLFIPQGILERAGEAAIEDSPASDIVIAPQPDKSSSLAQAEKPSRSARSRKNRSRRHEKVLNFAEGGPSAIAGQMMWPTQGKVTSRFGWRHHPILNRMRFHCGVDISAPAGSPIRAVAPGRVIFTGWHGASGRTVVVRHANNLISLYAHCSSIQAHVGETVSVGEPIARVGSSGRATGSHLHFAMERGKTPVNPLKYLR
ncbi:MAG: M23 family metallopeptidase [Candidatus Riflebacteria bacterium]|nr:M23 family metallopeptidase [Candidatus Riflebacteria bacterium]